MAALVPYLHAFEPYAVPAFSLALVIVGGTLLGGFAAGPLAAAIRG